MEPFKNIFNKKSIKNYSRNIVKVHPSFNSKSFEKAINKELETLELKQRVRLIARELHNHLPDQYSKCINILIKTLIPEDQHIEQEWEGINNKLISGFMVWPYTQFVEEYGVNNFKKSCHAMYEMTKRFSSEFVIREYLNHYPDKMYPILKKWSRDKNHHVRRLVSEGTRPNLPWGKNLSHQRYQQYIDLIITLKNDESEYVRRSVANHLNDISHLDEKLFIRTIKKMKDDSIEVNKLIRHASRTLLKKGNKEILKIHGYNPSLKTNVKFQLKPKRIKEGDKFNLNLKIQGQFKNEKKVIIEYVIHYLKKNGKYSPKVFRLRDTRLKDNLIINKTIHFKKVTTRVHYTGKHLIDIKINGKTVAQSYFTLED